MSDDRDRPTDATPLKLETAITRVEMGREPTAVSGDHCLIVFYGQGIGRRYFLNREQVVLGRSDTSHIQVDQDAVSRQHAKITMRLGGEPLLEDLQSTNGTFVNNQRIEQCALRDGDLVRVGQTVFKHLCGNNIESKYHEEIYRLTTIDGLTEIYNKRYLLDTLERETNRAARYSRALSLALFDIDHFKRINDTHGHLAGDQVLRELSKLTGESLRKQDVFARFGGEEFALVLPELAHDGAMAVSEKIRAQVQAHPFSFNKVTIPVTISVGVAAFVDTEETVEALIARADAKLYEAKTRGRNQVAG